MHYKMQFMHPSILVVHEIRLNKLRIGRTVTSVKQDKISNAMQVYVNK